MYYIIYTILFFIYTFLLVFSVLLHADHQYHKLNSSLTQLPVLVPRVPIKLNFDVSVITNFVGKLLPGDLSQDNSIIKVIILKTGQVYDKNC